MEKLLFEYEDIKLYKPNKKQEVQLRDMIEKTSKIEGDTLNVNAGFDVILYILSELSTIPKEKLIKVNEIDDYLDNDFVGVKLSIELEKLVEYIGDKMHRDYLRQQRDLNNFVKAIEQQKQQDELKKHYNKISKKLNLPDFDTLIKDSQEQKDKANKYEKFEKLINE